MDSRDAVLESVRTRIRPIFMTTITTILGSLPLVLFPGAGSELYRGLGSVVLGGLLVSTIFTLFLVPTLFSLTMDAKGVVADVHHIRERKPAELPPADLYLFSSPGRMGKPIGSRDAVHPNDHVNRGQSSNDVIPTALHVSCAEEVARRLLPALEHLHEALAERSRAFDHVVKIGRTHLQDATPVRLGQVFSGFAQQVQNGAVRLQESIKSLSDDPMGYVSFAVLNSRLEAVVLLLPSAGLHDHQDQCGPGSGNREMDVGVSAGTVHQA